VKPTDTPIASPEIVLREEFDDWAVLFHPLTGEAVGAGPVGVAIWKMLDGQRTLEDIAVEIEAQCEDAPAPASVLEDTIAFVDDLQRRLFVTLSPDGILVE
jgi:SynChlorMet cassette protein ScmD